MQRLEAELAQWERSSVTEDEAEIRARLERELEERIRYFKERGQLLEAQRIKQRTEYDLEMLREVGMCQGIENYSRVLSRREPGSQPFTLLDYFPKDYEIVKYSDLYKKKAEPTASSLIGKKAPGWILENIEAQPVSLADCKSKIILINFTGIGCGACQAAVPFLKQLKELFTSEEFELIAIESWSRKVSAIRNYANRKELNYEGTSFGQENVRQVQDYPTSWQGSCNLRESSS